MMFMRYGAVAALRHCGRRTAVLGLVALASACAAAGPAVPAASAPVTSRFAGGGISAAEGGIRHYLARNDSLALRSIAGLPGDTLLRLLHRGLAYHRLGNWTASNLALQAAEGIAEDRYTRSVKQALGAALINDKTIDYNPPPHERAFMHYYGMLNYLSLGDRDAALVEARKANAFLERYVRENGDRTYTTDASVEYLAGLLQLAQGDKDDAIVSLRRAGAAYEAYRERYGVPSPRFVGADLGRLATELGITEVATSVSRQYQLSAADVALQKGSGELLVLIENGYIAHRIERKLYIPILKAEADALSSGGLASALIHGIPIVDRTLTLFIEKNRGNEYAEAYEDGYILGAVVTGGDVVSMAWPKYSLFANGVEDVTVTVGTSRQEALVVNDLSAIAARHFEEEKAGIVRRSVFRAAGKYALSKYAEQKAEQAVNSSGAGAVPGAGWFAGKVAKAGAQAIGNATEQADTRSWSSLPAEIRAARFTLPPGDHNVTLNVLDADGSTRAINLGVVKVGAGETVVRNAFVSGSYRGSARRFANAVEGVNFRASVDVASGAMAPVAQSGAAGAVGAAAAAAGLVVGAAPAAAVAPPRPAEPAGPGALATVLAVRPVESSMRPLAGETVRFAVQMRNSPAVDRRERAQFALFVSRQGGADTTHVWSGVEGDTAVWNGTIGDQPVTTGWYNWTLRATTPRGRAPTEYSWTSAVNVDAPNGSALAPEPPELTLEPETRVAQRPDYAKKKRRFVWGLVFTGLGAGASTAGYSMATTAISGTPPGSPERQMAFNVWAGGVAVSTIGVLLATRGWLKDYTRDVNEADAGAVQRNQEARLERARAVAAINAENEKVRQSHVLRIRTVDSRQGAAGGRRP